MTKKTKTATKPKAPAKAKVAAKPKAAATAKVAAKPTTASKPAATMPAKTAAKAPTKTATKAKTAAKAPSKPKSAAKPKTVASARNVKKFNAPQSQDFTISDNSGVIGQVRVKPNAVAWKPKRGRAFHQISLEQLAAFAAEHGREVQN